MPHLKFEKESDVFVEEMKRRIKPEKYGGAGTGIRGNKYCLTQTGKACGTSAVPIHLYIEKKRNPSLCMAIRIANHLGIDLGKVQKKCRRLK